MSAGWEVRLASRVIGRAFEDVLASEPGSRRLPQMREDRVGLARRNQWRRDRRTATEFLFSPEFEADREHWFAQAKIRLPSSAEAMTRAIHAFACGGPEMLDETDEPFEEPAIEEPVDAEEEAEAA